MSKPAFERILAEETFWYSTIELADGVMTPGLNIPTVSHPRKMLRSLDLKGLNCLDIGCVEGVLPVLMHRQGAASVVAYDRVDWTRKVHLVQDCYEAPFTYIAGMNYETFQKQALSLPQHPFDLVNFSGVLYHMLDPIGGLLRTRSLVRDGGLVIVETSALLRDEDAIYFNNEGKLLSPPNLCVPTLAWLDFILRLCRLSPLDLLHTGRAGGAHPDHLRITILCRAVSEPMVYRNGQWDSHTITDFADYLDWSWMKSTKAEVPIRLPPHNARHRGDGSLDIFKTVSNIPPTRYPPEDIALHLRDRS